MTFRHRPLEVEARQWSGLAEERAAIAEWLARSLPIGEGRRIAVMLEEPAAGLRQDGGGLALEIEIDGGPGSFQWMNLSPGDWLVLHPHGRVETLVPVAFERDYEPAPAAA